MSATSPPSATVPVTKALRRAYSGGIALATATRETEPLDYYRSYVDKMAVVPAPTSTNVVPLDCYRGYVDGMRVVLASRASSAAALDYYRAFRDGMRAR